MTQEKPKGPSVDMELPIVAYLIKNLGDKTIRFADGETVREGTVREAFEQCGALSEIGRQDPTALVARIQQEVNLELIRAAEQGEV